MDKKYLAKIIATDNEGLQMISACCAGGKVKISDLSNEKTVDFFSDFTQLKFVKIVSFKKETK